MEIVSYLFKNGIRKEEMVLRNCPGKNHSGCARVTKSHPCGCVEYLIQHFIYSCPHCQSNAKSLVIEKAKKLCPTHKVPIKQSQSHVEHRIDALRRFYAK